MPSELERLPYWQYEVFIEFVNDINKKEEESQKNENNEMNKGVKSGDINKYRQQFGLDNFKMPSMPSMPKI